MKGSGAHGQLEEAFASVPPSFAEVLRLHLIGGEGPLAKLFRYRLAPLTQKAMLQILVNKAKAYQQQKREDLRRKEQENGQETEELRQKMCAKSKEIDAISQELCMQKGEGSDACLSARAEALEANYQSRRKGIRCA